MTAETPSDPKTPSGRFWPLFVVGLLALNVGVCAMTVTASIRNPAQVESGYYEKAANWDEHRALSNAESQDTEP